jgi:hypothetical protein
MSKTVNFQDHTEYNEKLAEALSFLSEMQDELYNHMISLATMGKWKKWSDKQPIGSFFSFTEDMMRNTGDKHVDAFLEIYDKVEEVKGRTTIARIIKKRELKKYRIMTQDGCPAKIKDEDVFFYAYDDEEGMQEACTILVREGKTCPGWYPEEVDRN